MNIEINCTGSDTIQLHELTEFQGELKERSAGDVEKIIKSIKKHGFSFPFFLISKLFYLYVSVCWFFYFLSKKI